MYQSDSHSDCDSGWKDIEYENKLTTFNIYYDYDIKVV